MCFVTCVIIHRDTHKVNIITACLHQEHHCMYIHTCTVYAALTVSFGESDVSVTEKDKHVTVSVTKAGLSRGNITCTLIPLSVEQAFLQYGYQPDGSSDPAEIGDSIIISYE